MDLEFNGILNRDFQALVAKARTLAAFGIITGHKRKELIDYASRDERIVPNDEIKLIYALENPENVRNILCKTHFEPENFTMKIPVTFLGQTKTGAKLTIDERKLNEGGGLGKFVCDHTARITNAFKESRMFPFLQATGFLHIPERPVGEHISEVIGLGIAGLFKQYCNKNKSMKIMLTGFTSFRRVKDNPSGRFLFDDGTSSGIDSFLFCQPRPEAETRIDQMMKNQFGAKTSGSPLIESGLSIGRKYLLPGKKNIELILVRLPVDTNIHRIHQRTYEIDVNKDYEAFKIEVKDNLMGDRVQQILHYTIGRTKPEVVLSLGTHCFLPSDIYEIETEISGLDPKYSKGVRPAYPGRMGKGKNTALAEAYRQAIINP